MNLTNEQIMVLVGLVNARLTGMNWPKVEGKDITHTSNQGQWTCDAFDLARALVEEATARSIIEVPACFTGRVR